MATNIRRTACLKLNSVSIDLPKAVVLPFAACMIALMALFHLGRYSPLAWVMLFLLFLVIVVALDRNERHILRPKYLVGVFYLVYSVSDILSKEPNQIMTSHHYVLWLTGVGLVAFYIGHVLVESKYDRQQSRFRMAIKKIDQRTLTLAALLVVTIGVGSYLAFLILSGALHGVERGEFMRRTLSARFSTLAAGQNFMIVGLLVYLLCVRETRGAAAFRWRSVLFGAVLLLLAQISSDRTIFLAYTVTVALAWHYFNRPISPTKAMIGTILGLVAVQVMGQVRGLRDISDMLVLLTSLELSDVLLSHGEFTSAGRNLEILVRHVPGQYDFMLGKTYVWALAAFVPKLVVPTRPATAQGWFNALFYAGSSEGYGLGFTAVGEAYLNWGTIGVFAQFLGLGILIGTWEKLIQRRRAGFGMLLLIYFIPVLLYWFRADIGALLSIYIKHYLLATAVILLGSRLFGSVGVKRGNGVR